MIYGDSASNFYRMIRRGEVPCVFRKTPRARIKICPREFVPWLRKQIAAGCNGSRSAVSKPQLNGKGTYVAEGCTEAWPGLDARTNGKKRGKEDRIASRLKISLADRTLLYPLSAEHLFPSF